jgi:pSer/pThr/pTyr-binding forkhead associated (FHA) protein
VHWHRGLKQNGADGEMKTLILKNISNGAEVTITSNLMIGRDAENGVVLTGVNCSRRHALLVIFDDAVWLEDLRSKNGTCVNDERIHSKTKLDVGDRVLFDVEEYLVCAADNESEADITKIRPTDARRDKRPSAWVENLTRIGSKTRLITQEMLEELHSLFRPVKGSAAELITTDIPILSVFDGSRIALKASDTGESEWTVGSEGPRDILLKYPGVSAFHATIRNRGKRWKVINQLATNGIFVNGERCAVRFLQSGDRVAFGPVQCRFYLPMSRDTAGTSDAVRSHWLRFFAIAAILAAVVAFALVLTRI